MARDETPPFARGETFYNGSTKDPVFTDPLNYLGREYRFEPNGQDADTGYPAIQSNDGRAIFVRVVQNTSGVALLPKRVARYQIASPLKTQCDGYFFNAADFAAGVIDEFLPPAGVPNGDLFYLVVEGPTQCLQLASGQSSIAIGDRLEVHTGSTSATDASCGLVDAFAGSPTEADALRLIGRADGASNTASAAFPVVVNFHKLV